VISIHWAIEDGCLIVRNYLHGWNPDYFLYPAKMPPETIKMIIRKKGGVFFHE